MSPLDTFMFDWFGDTLFNVVVFNLVLIGPASFAAGHAVALTWRPWPQIVFYTALLSATFAYRLTRARQMVRQYPWLYRRKGLLGWDDRL